MVGILDDSEELEKFGLRDLERLGRGACGREWWRYRVLGGLRRRRKDKDLGFVQVRAEVALKMKRNGERVLLEGYEKLNMVAQRSVAVDVDENEPPTVREGGKWGEGGDWVDDLYRTHGADESQSPLGSSSKRGEVARVTMLCGS